MSYPININQKDILFQYEMIRADNKLIVSLNIEAHVLFFLINGALLLMAYLKQAQSPIFSLGAISISFVTGLVWWLTAKSFAKLERRNNKDLLALEHLDSKEGNSLKPRTLAFSIFDKMGCNHQYNIALRCNTFLPCILLLCNMFFFFQTLIILFKYSG